MSVWTQSIASKKWFLKIAADDLYLTVTQIPRKKGVGVYYTVNVFGTDLPQTHDCLEKAKRIAERKALIWARKVVIQLSSCPKG